MRARCDATAGDAAEDGADHGDPRVAPVRIAFAGDWQDRVRDARAEVTGRVDGVARRATERHTDAEHEQRHEEEAERRGVRVRTDHEHADDEHRGADDLGDEVRDGLADGRTRREHGELEARVRRLLPVREVREPDEHGTDERAEELASDERTHVTPGNGALVRERDRHGRVEVRDPARYRDAREDAEEHRHRPTERDDDPPRAVALGLVQERPGDDTVTEEDQDRGPDDFSHEHAVPPPWTSGWTPQGRIRLPHGA